LFRHLETLTWSFIADAQPVYAIYVYSEPRETAGGTIYAPRMAAESGPEGLACVDDVARAALLAMFAHERSGERHLSTLARRWLSFVYYMQLPDGRFTNFVHDQTGRRNLNGLTSRAGGAWWTARALWALAAAYRVLGDEHALAALSRCPIPPPYSSGELKTRAVLALAGCELLQSDVSGPVRALWQRRVRRWCDTLVAAAEGQSYVPDVVGNGRVCLWGYHQLLALTSAATVLHQPSYLEAAERTAWGLVRPVLAGNFFYAYPDDRANQCAYCISPMVQGLAALYRATGKARFRTLALRAAGWFAGANDAGATMYDVTSGRCLDGLTGLQVSRNCGAESAIEAGFAELERRSLMSARAKPLPAALVS
jgi:hypothetical protein